MAQAVGAMVDDLPDFESPRLLEACLRTGILPEELRPRPVRAFEAPDASAEKTAKRAQFFERRRQDKVSMVLERRAEICDEQVDRDRATPVTGRLRSGPGVDAPPASAMKISTSVSAGEIRRIETIKKRQEKELQRLIQGEQKMAELQARILTAEREERARQVEHEKRVKVQVAKEMAKQKEIAARKAIQEEEEKKVAKKITAKEREHQKKLEVLQAQEAKDRAERAREKDFERTQKLVDQARRSEAALTAVFEEAEVSQARMAERQVVLMEKMDAAKEKRCEAAERQRIRAEQRVARCLDANARRIADDRAKYERQQAEAQARHTEKAEKDAEKTAREAKARKERDHRRKQRLIEALQTKKQRRQEIVEHRRTREQFYSVVTAERIKQIEEVKLQNEFENVARLENVARIRRLDDFKRLQLNERVQQDDYRTALIKANRQMTVEERKKYSHDAFLRKQRIRDAMNQMRITNKYVSLDAIIDGPNATNRNKHGGAQNDENDKADALA